MKKEKILLLFPDGVGIRNYLYSNVFKDTKEDLVLFHAFDTNTEHAVKQITKIDKAVAIPKYNESIKEKFYRELICLTRLKHNAKLVSNPTILTNWKKSHTTLKNKLFYKSIEFCSKLITNYDQILTLEKKYQKTIRKNSFYSEVKSIFTAFNPSQIFCSHQRGLQCATIFAAATDLGIKTTTVIYSWDNLPKARLALQAENYFVWSDYMKAEMQLYYPEILQDKVLVTGTPQFECYEDMNNCIPKEEFYTTYNLDLNKKIICFSGDDSITSPDDPKYLNDLAEELQNSGLDKEYQILFRRCPVDISGRYDAIVDKYQHIIKLGAPLWNFDATSSWTTIYPLREDIKLLVSTAFYSDVVVNVGSTMAFDFAMFHKPCIFINYDQEVKCNKEWSVNTIYQFQHFRSMPNKNCVIWWNKKSELSHIIEKDMKSYSSTAATNWLIKVIGDKKNASKNISNVL